MLDDDFVETLVIDNGTWMCRAGWAGADSARAYCRTVIGKYDGRKCFDYEAIVKASTIHCPMDRGIITDWEGMEEIWSFIVEKELRFAKQCKLPMLITEVPHNPKGNRETMAQILMEKFDVASLCFFDPATLSLFASGRTSGIVLDVGHGVTHTSGLFDGYQIKDATRRFDLGGYDVNMHLAKKLLDFGYCFSTPKEMQKVDEMKLNYTLPDGIVLSETEKAESVKCHRVLFEPTLSDASLPGVHEVLNESIHACPVDTERDLFHNIILAGGPTMCREFWTEYSEKRLGLLPNRPSVPVKIIAPPERRKSAWIGGSIVASLSGFHKQCRTRQDYYEYGPTIFHTEYFCTYAE